MTNSGRRRSSTEELGIGATLYILGLSGMAMWGPFPMDIACATWLMIGFAWVLHRVIVEADYYKSNVYTEFMLAWKSVGGSLSCAFILWPLDMIIAIASKPGDHTFRGEIAREIFDGIVYESGSVRDWTGKASDAQLLALINHTRESGERLKELPHLLILDVRTTYARGATIAALATTTVPVMQAVAAVPAVVTNATVVATSSGWVAVKGTVPIKGKPEEELEYARVTASITDTRWSAGIFGEVDADQMRIHGGDWLPQNYLFWNPSDTLGFRFGRMFVSAGWSTPAPHSIPTINYPRIPFAFVGDGIQAEIHSGTWHVLADVSGHTDLRFDNPHQFGQMEQSMRIERQFGANLTLALTEQVSGRFARGSFDLCAHPEAWLDLRGMVYASSERGQNDRFVTTGGYAYVGVQPIASLPELEVHGQVDTEKVLGGTPVQPLILTVGTRLQFDKGIWSLTADFQQGAGSGASPGELLLRVQRKF